MRILRIDRDAPCHFECGRVAVVRAWDMDLCAEHLEVAAGEMLGGCDRGGPCPVDGSELLCEVERWTEATS